MFELLAKSHPFRVDQSMTTEQLKLAVCSFEGILAAVEGFVEPGQESETAKCMLHKLRDANVGLVAQDLLSRLLNPRPNRCSSCSIKLQECPHCRNTAAQAM